jgi:hypothetical protein
VVLESLRAFDSIAQTSYKLSPAPAMGHPMNRLKAPIHEAEDSPRPNDPTNP